LMRKIKHTIDPMNLFNPGKVRTTLTSAFRVVP
jgi:FAD/FMN-containing dehydrogenase